MAKRKTTSQVKTSWLISLAVVILVFCMGIAAVRGLLQEDDSGPQRRVCRVMLLKPPPPPKIERKPLEPEVKRVEVETPAEEIPQEVPQDADDAPPPGDDLGLDADGSGSGDAFGLLGKKGGRALIGSDFGQQDLLRRFAWYVRILQEEIAREVRGILDRQGGIPDGNLVALVEIRVDPQGNIRAFQVLDRSGHPRVDDALEEVLRTVQISEPPPAGMPRTMKIKITSHS